MWFVGTQVLFTFVGVGLGVRQKAGSPLYKNYQLNFYMPQLVMILTQRKDLETQ